MLITLIKNNTRGVPLKICVSEVGADAVISAMATDGWSVLSKCYGPSQPMVDCVQVALLDVSALPARAPMRMVVEHSASAAMLSAPM
jgi:hypothetical protein